MATQGYGRTCGEQHRVRYALGAASYHSAPEPKPGHGTVVVLSRKTQTTHCYERSIAGLSEGYPENHGVSPDQPALPEDVKSR